MALLDSELKRTSLINSLLPFGRILPMADGVVANPLSERESLLNLYAYSSPSEDPPPAIVLIVGAGLHGQAASLTGLIVTLSQTNVKPVGQPVTNSQSWADLVRSAEGSSNYSRRNRYVAYKFGNGGRQFWDNADGKL